MTAELDGAATVAQQLTPTSQENKIVTPPETKPGGVPPELRERLQRLDTWRSLFRTPRPLHDRLNLLYDFGLTDHDLAAVIPNAKARAVRRWRAEGPPSTRTDDIWRSVDDLYYTVSYFLADGSYDEDGIIAWVRSRQPELGGRRPLEVLRSGHFHDVRVAAEAVLRGGSGISNEDVVKPPPRRPGD